MPEKEAKTTSAKTEVKTDVKAEAKTEKVKSYETKYSVSELVEAAATFGAKPLIVKTALMDAGKESYTVSEAKNIINSFKNKEVKA